MQQFYVLTHLSAVLFCLFGGAKTIDWIPVTLKVRVQDAQGNDLLDPEKDNSWIIGTVISFRGITVELNEESILSLSSSSSTVISALSH